MRDVMFRSTSVGVLALTVGAASLAAQQTVTLPARDKALAERPANVFSVGAEEGESWELLSGVRSVAFDRADNLYVLDAGNSRVLVFSPAGRFVRQFGRRGGGPGEMQAPVHVAVAADGNVVVNDIGNRAFIVFKPTGEHVTNISFGSDAGFPTVLFADPRGGVVTRATPRPAADGQNNMSSILRQPLNEREQPVTLVSFPVVAPQIQQSGGTTGAPGTIRVTTDPVFSARPTFGVLPDGGVALHTGAEYAVRIYDPSGRHVRTIARDHRLRKVTKKDQDAHEARQREARASGAGSNNVVVVTMGGSGGGSANTAPPPSARDISITPTYAEFMSAITSVRTDLSGRVWIQRRHEDGSDRGPIDLVDATGRYIGTLPPQQAPSAISASGLAAYTITDDMGVERVVVRRLPASWR